MLTVFKEVESDQLSTVFASRKYGIYQSSRSVMGQCYNLHWKKIETLLFEPNYIRLF